VAAGRSAAAAVVGTVMGMVVMVVMVVMMVVVVMMVMIMVVAVVMIMDMVVIVMHKAVTSGNFSFIILTVSILVKPQKHQSYVLFVNYFPSVFIPPPGLRPHRK
jgi:hypothetical protein